MARCAQTKKLEVHPITPSGGNGLDNAMILCPVCLGKNPVHGQPGSPLPVFTETMRVRALVRAGYQCECISAARGCH